MKKMTAAEIMQIVDKFSQQAKGKQNSAGAIVQVDILKNLQTLKKYIKEEGAK